MGCVFDKSVKLSATSRKMKLLLLIVVFITATATVSAQGNRVKVRTITAQTEDLLTFRVSLPVRVFGPREDVVISYTVKNDSRKIAYLVLGPKTRPKIDEKQLTIGVQSPVKYQEEWNSFDNTFVKLSPGGSYSGKLVIDGAAIPPHPTVETEDWMVQVEFAYVFNLAKNDVDELLECVGTTYSFPCLGKLDLVAKVFTIGSLFLEVKSP